ncbi:hypothetical protein BJX61DRAFT_501636 [Aspergillus egyptiacus]|nr:hypothetical protein BJX61DRAFT_501636 [Aspergillus egyptiacus]
MARGCGYNCSERPEYIEFDADITGPGVLVGYIASAGIVVVLISVHYFLAYQPTLDPFRDKNDVPSPRAVPFRPNRVDLMILRFCRRTPEGDTTLPTRSRWSYLNAPLIECVLTMSDLQLATGIAILTSGYTQLTCGLSCFHWSVIGRLAWFSSLTHLSCLTLLRNYLYNRKPKRQWRLLAMLVLNIMLITALVPTGNSCFGLYFDSLPVDYAICHFSVPSSSSGPQFASMLVLVLLVGLGFFFRVIKLHRPLAIFVIEKLRKNLSDRARRPLWVLYRWRNVTSGEQSWLGTFLYYPALALFLTIRVTLDHLSSMAFEVYWLIASFLVGLFGFLRDVNILFPDGSFNEFFQDTEDNTWSFGQIMPIALLAVPLIHIIETLYTVRGQKTAFALDVPSPRASMTVCSPINDPDLHPDEDYYFKSTALKAGSVYIFICEIGLCAWFVVGSSISTVLIMAGAIRTSWLVFPAGLWAVILVSFRIDRISAREGARYWPALLQTANVVFFAGVSAVLMFMVSTIY